MFQPHEAYDAVFAAMKLTVKFNVVEIAEMRTTKGVCANHLRGDELNHATGTTSRGRISSFSFFTIWLAQDLALQFF